MRDLCANSCAGNSPSYVKPLPFRQDDAIWVQYINAATAEDDKMIRSWAESLDVLLVFVRLGLPVAGFLRIHFLLYSPRYSLPS